MTNADPDLVAIPKYAFVYVDQVIGEYQEFRNANPDRAIDDLAKRVIDKYCSGESPTWGDLYALERLLVRSESLEALLARELSLRTRYTALSGTSGQQLPTFDAAKVSLEAVRAYVESMLREMYRLIAVTACRERLRKRRLTGLVSYIGVIGLVLFSLLILFAYFHHLKAESVLRFMPVPLMGALGGFISSQRRMQSIAGVGESLTDMTNLYFWSSTLAASAMSGAVFATVLYMLFAGGLVQGKLFPILMGAEFRAAPEDFAKLLIWSFIAGFAERFVPDTLDRLVAKSAKEQ